MSRTSKAGRSLSVFGLYLATLGLFLLIAPNALITSLGLRATHDVWIRVVGMLLVWLAFFDVQAARHEVKELFRWSAITRAAVIVFFAGFVAARLVQPVLLLFGGVDLAAAAWTVLALRHDRKT